MSYRADDRLRCAGCDAALSTDQVFRTSAGGGLCRGCSSREAIAETQAQLEVDHREARTAPPPSPARVIAAYLLVAPIAVLGAWCAYAAIDFWLQPRACSELGCIGMLLIPVVGLAVAGPCALAAIVLTRDETRRIVAIIAAVATASCVASCVAPM